jgi:hypothetical protein
MKRLILLGAAALALVMAPVEQASAQQRPATNQLVRLTSRTEARARGARSNFERLHNQYPEFLPELQRIAARLGTRHEWLLNVIASESSFIPSARNPLPGQTASGLLQIIEGTAAGMGTTTAAIRQMNPVEQLRLVERFYSPFRGQLNSQGDVYLAAFRGFIVRGGPETVVAPLNDSAKERRAYSLNRGLDFNGDGFITKGELAATAYGVGRFGEVQLVAATRAQAPLPRQQKATADKPAAGSEIEPPPSRAMSLYVATTAGSKAVAETPSSEPTASRVSAARTRSIYVQ